MATASRVKELLERFKTASADRAQWEAHWQDIAEVVLPQHATFTIAHTPGNERRRTLYDSTAVFANETFASQLASQLINPALKWFGLRLVGEATDLNEDEETKAWLEAVRDTILDLFGAPRTAFIPSTYPVFLELGAFGTGCLFVQEVPGDGVRFLPRPLAEVYILENARNQIDTVMRRAEMPLRHIASYYGLDAMPEKMRRDYEKEPDKKTPVIHFVLPRADRDARKVDAKNKPFASIHISQEYEAVLAEGGFDEFPYVVPRWFTAPGETYGRSPGLTTLPDNRMLQAMKEVTIRGVQKEVDPPLVVPDDGVIGPVRQSPSGLTIVRAGLREIDHPHPLQTGAKPQLGEQFMQVTRDNILRAFYVDQTLFSEPKTHITAEATLDRRDHRFQRMTPMIARVQAEFLVPLLDRVFAIMQRQGLLPPPPGSVPDGAELKFEMVSPAIMAQRMSEADNMSRFLARITPVLELDPDGTANLDVDAFIHRMGENMVVPHDILRAPDQVRALREEQAQKRAEAEALQQVQGGSEAAVNITKALQNEQATTPIA